MASTVVVSPAWTLQNQNTAPVGRLHDGAFLQQVSATPNTQVRPGVIPTVGTSGNSIPIDLYVSQSATPAMTVAVNPGNWVATNSLNRGPYVAGATGLTTLTVTTADASNPRLDLVYAQVIDTVASDTGTSSSILGIVTGIASGSPVLPSLPTNGVCISLAQVAVAAGATSITNSNITDLRKSSGVGRGPRFMLPGDALSDPGYCYGELRQRLLTSYPSNGVADVVTDYWGFDSAWHGGKTLAGLTGTWQNGTSDIVLSTSVHSSLVVVTVPDPGYPYFLECSGCVAVVNGSSWSFTTGLPSIDVLITLTSPTGTVINGVQGNGYYTAAGAGYNASAPAKKSARLTGSQTAVLSAQNLNTAGGTMTASYTSFTGNKTWLNVDVVPA